VNRRTLAAVVAALVLVAACSGDDDDGAEARPRTPETRPVTTDRNVVAVFAVNELRPAIEQLVLTFQSENAGVTVQTTFADTSELRARIERGEAPNFIIDTPRGLRELPQALLKDEPVPFGADLLMLAVARGNPKNIKGLEVFGNDRETRSGMCARNTRCGRVGQQSLERAKVTVDVDVVEENGESLIGMIAVGRLDAALVLRSERGSRIKKITALALDQSLKQRTTYEMARVFTSDIGDKFAEFVETSESANKVLKVRGLRPLQS
jgi:ABC-type molybdate transport system substrate-binding protein